MDETPGTQPNLGREQTGCAVGAGLAAAPFYLFTASIIGFERQNPEDGMLIGFMMIAELPLWMALALFLALITKQAQLPQAVRVGMWVILPLAGGACFWALGEMGTSPNWMAITPVGLPIVAMLFGFWARGAAEAPAEAVRKFALGFGLVALALCAVPVVGHAIWVAGEPERQARYEQEQRESAALTAAMDARCAALNPDTPLEDYLDFLEGGSCYEKAHEVIARAPRRQGDAERLLTEDVLDPLKILNTLPLEATPALCRNYQAAMDRRIESLRTTDPNAVEFWSNSYDQVTNFSWFMARGCDLSPQLLALAALYRANSGTSSLADGLDSILRNGVGSAAETNAAN